MSRARLIRICRSLMVRQYGRRNAPKSAMEEAATVLDQDILTIAFARRFATYKRAHLLLMDPDRLKAMLTSPTMPVQLVFAGKAHPKDNEGKDLIKKVVEFARQPEIRNRVIFLEDYDINIARHVVQGADIWLNTPRRPMEACGTSGMKAAVNGVLNLSVLDGWWCEGYSSERGWRIGQGEDYVDPDYQDAVESRALYNVLENEVLPAFYDRKNGDAPFRWIKMMKASMKMIMQNFCAVGMLDRYASKYYAPAFKSFHALLENDAQQAKSHHLRQERLIGLWNRIKVEHPKAEIKGPFRVGDQVRVFARVGLGEILPEEVSVQVYYGTVKSLDELNQSLFLPMEVEEDLGNGAYRYARSIDCQESGRFGYTVRVVPAGGQPPGVHPRPFNLGVMKACCPDKTHSP